MSAYLVDVTHDHWREENLREGYCHGVHSGHHGGVHEVDGVAVEEDGGTAHRHTNNDRPENMFEAWQRCWSDVM